MTNFIIVLLLMSGMALGQNVRVDIVSATLGGINAIRSPITAAIPALADRQQDPFGGSSYFACESATNYTQALTNLLATIKSNQTKLILFGIEHCELGNITIPSNVTLDFASGGGIKLITGQKVTLLGPIVPTTKQIFYNAFADQGTVDFTGNSSVDRIYPEWWGASPNTLEVGVNTRAIQAAIYGAFGCGPDACRTNASGLSKWNRELHLSGIYQINDELKLYHVNNFLVTGEGRLNSGINQTAPNRRIIDGECVAYGRFDGLTWSTTASQTVPLLDFDNDGMCKSVPDLSPQFITFDLNTFNGNDLGQIGALFAKSGGSAQGSNIVCNQCEGAGFAEAAWQFGGNNTGINAGRFYATNALANAWIGGDFQRNQHYGIAAYGGNYTVGGSIPTTFENWSSPNGLFRIGPDAYCESSQSPCVMDGVRSEDVELAAGEGFIVRNSQTVWRATQFYDGTRSLAGTTSFVGQVISGTGLCGDGKYYQVSNVGIYDGLGLTTATSGTGISIVNIGASWTTNIFVGQQVCVMSGTLTGFHGVITANTATTITVAGGWTTNYQLVASSPNVAYPLSPDHTSTFVVEPNWGISGSLTSSGTVAFAQREFNSLAGNNGPTPCLSCVFSNVTVSGGRIKATGAQLENLIVTRADFLNASLHQSEFATNTSSFKNIRVVRPGSQIFGGMKLTWRMPRETIGGYTNYSQNNVGSLPMVWSVGANGGTSASDTWIGGRSDPFSGNSVSRAVLEFGGVLGRKTPSGIDQPGETTQIQGGLSTGSGPPGSIEFWEASKGTPGSTINVGSTVASVDPAGFEGPLGSTTPSTGDFTNISLSGAFSTTHIANARIIGTKLHALAKLTGSPSSAVISSTDDTHGIVGVVVAGAGIIGNATIATHEIASCIFDGATTSGDYVQISSRVPGDCKDAGTSYPASGQIIGRVLSTNSESGTYALILGVDIGAGEPLADKYHVCTMIFGSDKLSAPILTGTDVTQTNQCFIPAPSTLVEIDVYADNGTPSIRVSKNHAGSITDLTTSDISTAPSGLRACSNALGSPGLGGGIACHRTLVVTSLAGGDTIQTRSVMSGGTARSVKVFVTYMIN